MIDIVYEPEKTRLRLQGHAGAGIPGQDLICCAASVMTYTAAANVRRMRKNGWLKQAGIRLTPGDAEIFCIPFARSRDRVRGRMDAVCLGFGLLAREYPDFVRFRITKEEVCYEEKEEA